MKKICFLIGDINNSGGTERVTTLIANELIKLNYNISIISLSGGDEPFFKLDNEIKIHSLYSEKISFKVNFFSLIWKLRSFIENHKIDTLVVVDSIACIFTVPALYRLNVNHICWEHFNFNTNLGIRSRGLGRQLAAIYCDYIVTLTQQDKNLWEHGLKNIKAKIVSIANPTPYENTNHIPSLEYKTVLAIGRLTYQKGFDLLIDAWALVCETNFEWTLRIVGSGEDEENLKQRVKKFGIKDRVDFVPSTRDVEIYYRTSSVYCLSSRFEGLPMVLLEAQAFGLPIVAFNCDTGPSELVNSKNGMLVQEESIQQLSVALVALMNSSESQYSEKVYAAFSTSNKFTVKNKIALWLNIL